MSRGPRRAPSRLSRRRPAPPPPQAATRRPSRPRRSRGGLALALGALGALGFAAPASALDAGAITRATGAVEATLTWDKAELGVANPHLKITRNGEVVLDGSIADVCPEGCFLVSDDPQYPDSSILHVADLARDGEIEVVVDTYSGGAHCCTVSRIYAYQPATNTFARVVSQFWGNSGYALKDLNGDQKPEFRGGDDAFAYAFSSYAASAFPPKILSFSRDAATGTGKMVDVTRQYPKLVAADAKRLLKEIRRTKPDGIHEIQGAIAAYVADEYLLGHGPTVGRPELRRAYKRGLTTKGFEAKLLKFLHKTGYR